MKHNTLARVVLALMLAFVAGRALAADRGIALRDQSGSTLIQSCADVMGDGSICNPALPQSNWSVLSAPGAATPASASKAAAGPGTSHTARAVTFCATGGAAGATPVALVAVIRDGATGSGTVIWSGLVGVVAGAGQTSCVSPPQFDLIGSAAVAMTAEFTAGAAGVTESVDLVGYERGQPTAPTATYTPTNTPTNTPTYTPTNTPTPTTTPTRTPTPTPTP